MGSGVNGRGLSRYAAWPLLCALFWLTACGDEKSQAEKAPKPPSVIVAEATSQTVPVRREFVGNTAAVKRVEIRAKVQGYLEERPFTEGADVKKGDILFVIDQRPFQAALEKNKADLEQNQAVLKFAKEQVKRYKSLSEQNAASVQKYESVQSQELEATSAVKASEAAVKNAQLDLDYTTITAPMDGRIGQTLVNIGNLVSEEDTLLTTLVQLDPIYAYFSPSEAEYQEIQSFQAEGTLKFTMILAGGKAYPHQGKLDFVDNHVDVQTGTIKMRAVFPNAEKTERPGQYIKVQIGLGENSDAILVPAPAIGEDEAGHYLFVGGKDNKVERRSVKLGAAFQDQYVIEDGVKAGENVIVKGLQKVHGNQVVNAELAAKDGSKKADQEKTTQ